MRLSPMSRLVVLAPALALAACVSGNSPVVVTGFHPLSPTATGCTVATGGPQLVSGLLDSNLGTGYVVGMSLLNQLNDDSNETRTGTNYAYVDTVTVKYRTDGTLAPPVGQKIAATAVLAAGSEVFVPLTILTSANGEGLAGQSGGLIADITVNGHLEDQTPFTTATESFPITVSPGSVGGCGTGVKPTASCGPDAAGQPDGFTCPASP